MNEKERVLENESVEAANVLNLEEFDLKPVSSAETIKPQVQAGNGKTEAEEIAAETGEVASDLAAKTEDDPIFKELAEPKLPELPRENRARLQMQSPNRIYFYWSLKNNPFQILQKVFGGGGSYRLVAKLVNQKTEIEEIHPVEAEGSRWYEVDADSEYRAEIGFYAPNRPFIRVLFSNAVETPRKSPSTRRDYSPDFAVSAQKFAQILKSSGYRQDAFEVALAGDDIDYADFAAKNAFSRLTGKQLAPNDDAGELRFALLALASGYALEDLRRRINPSLFAVLQDSRENLSAEQTLSALQENFEVFEDEFITEEETLLPTVFGASLLNFPRTSIKRRQTRRILPKFAPISSLKPF
jgi:hypothetical protein